MNRALCVHSSMPFEFVDNNAPIGRAARKRIRSHVAAGKNAGKTLVRPSRKKAFALRAENHPPKIPEPSNELKYDMFMSSKIGRQIGDGLSVMRIPSALSPRFRRIVQKALHFFMAPRHVPELNSVIDNTGYTTSMWVQSIFLDEAYFHCAIAMSVTAMNNLVAHPDDLGEALHHVSQTLHMVSKRLSGRDAASDANMKVVVVMIQFERHQGEYCRGAVHLDGLLKMVELRGGISHLTQYNPSLTQKIFRADLEFALYLGTATRFSIEDLMLGSTAILEKGKDSQKPFSIVDTPLFFKLRADIQELLLDIIAISQRLNIISTKRLQKLSSYRFHDTIILVGYRLIHVSPLYGSLSGLDDAVHLGLAAFLLTFLRRLDYKVSDMPLLHKLFTAAVKQLNDKESSQELLLWLLFIGKASIFTQADDLWIAPIAIRTMDALDLHTWQDVRHTLGKWPWVNTLHDKNSEALWCRSASDLCQCIVTPIEYGRLL